MTGSVRLVWQNRLKRDKQNEAAALTGQAGASAAWSREVAVDAMTEEGAPASRVDGRDVSWARTTPGLRPEQLGGHQRRRRGLWREGYRKAGRAQFGMYLIHKLNISMGMLNRQVDLRVSVSRSGPG